MRFKFDLSFAKLLSEVSKDICVAFFIAALVSPTFFQESSYIETFFVLLRNLLSGMIFLLLAWGFSRNI